MDPNKILNNKLFSWAKLDPNAGSMPDSMKGVAAGIPAAINMARMGLSDLFEAINNNPYKVNLQNQTYSGKSIMKNGGPINKKGKKIITKNGSEDEDSENEMKEPNELEKEYNIVINNMSNAKSINLKEELANGGMLKRADGSYSQKGLWDNIRANEGSGKKPTPEMLEQEAKIKNKLADGGVLENTEEVEGPGKGKRPPIYVDNRNDKRLKSYRDSLNLYKKTEDVLNPKYYTNKNPSWYSFNGSLSAAEKFITKNNIDFYSKTNEVPGKIKPIKLGEFGEGLSYPIYKKPEQPVLFKQPTIQPIPTLNSENVVSTNKQEIKPKGGVQFTKQVDGQPVNISESQYKNILSNASSTEVIKEGKRQMALGGKIEIKEENKGKFTESANKAGMSVQEFADKVLSNKEDYSTTQIKRANFARNAAGWKKAEGGYTVDPTNPYLKMLQQGTDKFGNWVDNNSEVIDMGLGGLSLLGLGLSATGIGSTVGVPLTLTARGLSALKTGRDVYTNVKEGNTGGAMLNAGLGFADIVGLTGATNALKSTGMIGKQMVKNEIKDLTEEVIRKRGANYASRQSVKRGVENSANAKIASRVNKIDDTLDNIGLGSDVLSVLIGANQYSKKNNSLNQKGPLSPQQMEKMRILQMGMENAKNQILQKGKKDYLDNKSSFPYGGIIKGPSHENGGVNVNENGKPTTEKNAVAEVEGGEYRYTDPITGQTYIFSDRLPYKTNNNGKKK